MAIVLSCALRLSAGTAVDLMPGAPIERELAGGETHEYRITLAAGQYVQVVAGQRGIDVQLAVFAPDGKQLISIDSTTALTGLEPVSVLAEISGAYRLEVSPVDKTAAKGHYQLRIKELRASTPQDKIRITAQKAFAEGRKLETQQTAESYQASLQKYEEALRLWQSTGEPWREAVTLCEIAEVNLQIGNVRLALSQSERTLSLWRSLGDIRGQGEVLNEIGIAHEFLGEPHRALEYYNEALSLERAAGDRLSEAVTLSNMGGAYHDLGQMREALESDLDSLALQRALVNHSRDGEVLGNIGALYLDLGKYQEALAQLSQGLGAARTANDRTSLVYILYDIGGVYQHAGDLQKATDYYTQALQLGREIGEPRVEADTLRNLGAVCKAQGHPRAALEYLAKALPLTAEDPFGEAKVRSVMGDVYADLGEKAKALDYYAQALQLQEKAGRVPSEVHELAKSAPLYADLGDTQKALETLDRALALSRSIQYKSGEAAALLARARVERDAGKVKEARADLEAALPIIESTRTELASGELRTSYFASNRQYYELYVDVLMRMHQGAAAFEASERARARSLLETLVETHADIRQGVDPALLEREQTLQQQLNATEQRRLQLLGKKDRTEQAAGVEKELNTLLSDYQDAQARIRTTSPRYAALTQPQPLTLEDIQQQVLDENSLLLEYSLGTDRSYLWAVTRASIESFQLPKRAEIESAAKQSYELLKSSDKREFQRQTELALTRLSQMLLGPPAGQLRNRRLLIVGDGALQYIPFEALPAPGSSQLDTMEPLVSKHEIVNLPSASVLAVLRREVAGREEARKAVAILSDPVFEKDDPRVARAQMQLAKVTAGAANATSELGRTELTRSATESGLGRFERLPFSRSEAESIERLAPPGQVLKAVDFSASKVTATSAEINQFRIVHFATHGLINSQHPELSGIVLSLVDEHGEPQDGFLRAHEIYNLKLSADLVVLSACQTALGKEIKGEGLLGLTRGFMYAGAPRVVASLWDVKDEAAAELMKRFYRAMFKENLSPAAALRAAQLSMWKEKRWESPYYWAAFVMQGEWR